MKKQQIGIIGQGFVGTAVREKFKSKSTVHTYDRFHPELCVTYNGEKIINASPRNTIESIVSDCYFVFICVPTPMFENGKCDTSIVESVINNLAGECEKQDKKIVAIIKSTVPPGTTESLNKLSKKVSAIFNPEFLTEANAIEDFANQNRIVLGIDWIELIEPVTKLFSSVFKKSVELKVTPSKEAEMAKYMTNLFLATKVSFFNDMYRICDKLKVNYDSAMEATILDPRIGKSHTLVPGPDGDFGYGGHCFPKDMQAMLHISTELKLALPTLIGAHTTNMIVRKNKNWEEMEGRAVVAKEVVAEEIPQVLELNKE